MIAQILRAPIAALVLLTVTVAGPSGANEFDQALQTASWHLESRLRYEHVDDDVLANAEALTLGTRFGYASGPYRGFSVLAELIDVRTPFGVNDFAPRRPDFAVIADPSVTTLNRGLLRYRGGSGLEATLGRQRIIYDNARHIGNVGWRQSEQTFDAFQAGVQPLPSLTLRYAYLDRVRGVTPANKSDLSSHLVHLEFAALPIGTLSGYGYFLDSGAAGGSRDTSGLRFAGSHALQDMTVRFAVEYAQQESGPFDTRYWHLAAAVEAFGFDLELGRESLGSDAGSSAFQTPLGTRHAFNGWADRFLTTPDDGLVDSWASLKTRLGDFELTARHHWFEADRGGQSYGRETNLQIARGFGEHYRIGAKFADYRARSFSNDTTKVWLWAEIAF